jgi:hypothetical protein
MPIQTVERFARKAARRNARSRMFSLPLLRLMNPSSARFSENFLHRQVRPGQASKILASVQREQNARRRQSSVKAEVSPNLLDKGNGRLLLSLIALWPSELVSSPAARI